MDSFEHVVASILERKGYWVQTSLRVDLSKAEKAAAGKPSMPRPELDVVAYKPKDKTILVMECKSCLDSYGVKVKTFAGLNKKDQARYKLFFDCNLRQIVFKKLSRQLVGAGAALTSPKIRLGLAAGKIYGDERWLRHHFETNNWELWTPNFLRDELTDLKDSGYENSVASVVAKLLLRGVATEEPESDEGSDD